MKLKEILVLTTLLVGVLADSRDDVIQGTRTFTAKLYKELIKGQANQNLIFSPMTIETLMSLLMSASQNENDQVIQEIRGALNLPYGNQNRQTAFKEILDDLNKADDDFKVFDATKMYFNTGYSVENWYKEIARNIYQAEIEVVHFGNSHATTRSINQWVAKKTNNKIPNFVDFYDITGNIRNLLINALYLSGKWDKPFEKERNTWLNFNSPTGAKRVEMMTNNKTYGYYEDNNAQYLQLELVRDGGGAEMVFVLPKQQQGLTQIESNPQDFLKPVPFSAAYVDVTLPKFSFSNSLKLKPALQNLGIHKLFQWGAQLLGLRYPGHPYIIVTDVLQKAFIEVDEWGVTAAAATDSLTIVDAPNVHKTFTADHPFLFYIEVDEAIVYAGRVVQV